MEKELADYIVFIENEIEKIDRQKAPSEVVHRLWQRHQEAVQDFQHERLIHLIITLFFAFLWVLSAVGLVALTFDNNLYAFSVWVLIVNFILLVLEIFYIRHYYKLENGTQKLYGYSQKIYEMMNINR